MRRSGKSAGVVLGVLCASAVMTAVGSAQAKTSWSLVYHDANQGNVIMALDAIDATHAWALGESSDTGSQKEFAIGTTDGATWVTVGLPTGYQLMMALTLAFADANNGWMAGLTGKGGRVWRSTDGGSSWAEAASTPSPPLHMQAFPTGQMFAVGEKFVVVYDGQQYQNIDLEAPSGMSLASVRMLNPSCGYVLAKADSGSPAGSALFWTSDGGMTWAARGESLDYSLAKMSWVSKDMGWAAGVKDGAGIIARTTDAGLTWTPVNVPDHAPSGLLTAAAPATECWDVKFFDNKRGVATCVACTGGCDPDAGADPSLVTIFVRTEDSGQTWTMDPDYEGVMVAPPFPKMTMLSGMYSVAFPDPNHGFMAGTNNLLLRYVADTEEDPGWGQPTCESGGPGSGGSGAGASKGAPGGSSDSSGCGCHAAAAGATGLWLAAGLGLLAIGRRRRR